MRNFKFYKQALEELKKENIPDANGRIKRFIEIRKTKSKKKLIRADVWMYSVSEYIAATKPMIDDLKKGEDSNLFRSLVKAAQGTER